MGLYLRPAQAWLEIHSLVVRDLASVAALVIWDRLVSHRCSSGTSPQGALLLTAILAYSSAFSLPVIPFYCGGLADGNPIAPAQDPGADIHGRDSEALARADGVRFCSADRGEESGGRTESREEVLRSRKGFGSWVRQTRGRTSNTAIRDLLSDGRHTEAVLTFLRIAREGEVKEGVICR